MGQGVSPWADTLSCHIADHHLGLRGGNKTKVRGDMGSSTPTIVPFSASISLQKQNQQMWVYVAIGHLDFLVPKS